MPRPKYVCKGRCIHCGQAVNRRLRCPCRGPLAKVNDRQGQHQITRRGESSPPPEVDPTRQERIARMTQRVEAGLPLRSGIE